MEVIKKYFCLAFLSIFLLASPVWAACTGPSPWTCASYADLEALVEDGGAQDTTDGDTVNLSAGTYVVTSSINFPSDKAIILQGAGHATTSISRAGEILDLNESGSRVTGIKFIFASGGTSQSIKVQGTGWRIDNCYFDNDTGTSNLSIMVTGIGRTILPEGLIDNNEFMEGRILIFGMGSFAKCCTEWASASRLGSENNVFIEDNTFYKTVSNGGNVIDANRGASYVARFNTVGGKTQFMAHSLQSSTERAARSWEVYGNTFDSTVVWTSMYMRGGTGFIWDNTIDADYTSDIVFDNVRCGYSAGSAGECDGNSSWDENTGGESGWACRDQIGRGIDNTLWAVDDPYDQPSQPTYLWLNRTDASISSVYIASGDSAWIEADRDYYNEDGSFDGTSGVGVGTAAEFAVFATDCTAGVGYWVTDEGEWDSKSAGNDGCFYTCDVGDDAWTLYYTPSTYPHSLITGTEVSGTIIPGGCKESEVVDGNKTIAITLVGTEWVAVGETFDAQRQNILDGITASTSPANSWNPEWRDKEAVTAVVRTDATTVTVTMSSQAAIGGTFDISAGQTVTVTIPATATEEGVEIEATPTFVISAEQIGAESVSAIYDATGPSMDWGDPGVVITAP